MFSAQDMQIKVSKHVDLSGKIYLPYLHEWSYPNSDLVGLIQVCSLPFAFSRLNSGLFVTLRI
jgi:hypothetical protein